MSTPHVIGYLNPEIPGVRAEWVKAQIRRLATKLGIRLVNCPNSTVHRTTQTRGRAQ